MESPPCPPDLPTGHEPSRWSAGLRPGSMRVSICQLAGSETGAPDSWKASSSKNGAALGPGTRCGLFLVRPFDFELRRGVNEGGMDGGGFLVA